MATDPGLPFQEGIDHFRGKLNIPTERWTDLQGEQHAKGFMVAGAIKTELLTDMRSAVDKAISQGTTLAEFRKDFDSMVAKHGWDYNGGRNWRSEVIYSTNVRQAYNTGRWQQLTDPDLLKLNPYLEYRLGDSVHHRPLHQSWNGTVLPADDPWWQTHAPQNGWGCKCKVLSVGPRDLAKMGKDSPDSAPNDGTHEWVDKKTGEVRDIPNGIDPGFDYNPGQADAKGYRVLTEKFETTPPDIATQWMKEFVKEPAFERFIAGKIRGDFPVGILDEHYRKVIGSQSQTVWLSDDSLSKNKGEQPKRSKGHPELTVTDYQALPDVIGGPQVVIEKQGFKIVCSRKDKQYYLAVVKTTEDRRELFVQSFRRATKSDVLREMKSGTVLLDLLEK
jgi:Phage Mu protein F like protein